MRIKKVLLIFASFLLLGIGTAGIFLPLLPTTIFFLLAAACFLKSSEKLYIWLINHRIFGFYIKSYLKYRAITRFSRIFTIVLLWTTIGFSALFAVKPIWVRILLFVIAAGVTVHLVCLKSITPEMMRELDEKDRAGDAMPAKIEKVSE
ncbi:MAG: YbaN family protein [Spirochaetales bacterium]|nr:YbaN family protein [Spirochaetales bacterium]